ncbi:MAG: tetratricopeptide repeat protein, partial [Phycisphaerae bacterium]
MAKRKVVNKTVVGMLTVAGMLISVVLVGIVITVLSNKDPEIWATKGREYMTQGKYEDAQRMFGRAYENSKDSQTGKKDVNYLLEYSRAELAAGDVGRSFSNLAQAHAIKTDDVEILKEIISRLWEFRRYFGDRYAREELEYSGKLLALEPDNASATALRVIALAANAKENREYLGQARELLDQAKTRFPDNSRVALAELMLKERDLRQSLEGVTDPDQVKEATGEFRKHILEVGVPVVQKHPDDIYLMRIVVGELANGDNEAEAVDILDRAAAAKPDSLQVLGERAKFYISRAQAKFNDGDFAAASADADRVIEASKKGLAEAPGMLEFVSYWAGAELIKAGGFEKATKEDFEKTLEIFDSHFEKSLSLKDQHIWFARAALDHIRLILSAFKVATVYASQTTDEARKQRGQEWMKKFVDQADKRFAQNPIADFMRGRYHLVIGDSAKATTDFEKAAKSRLEDRMLFLQIFQSLPSHNLALLYRDLRQPGEALRWTEEATDQYEELNVSAPLDLHLNRGELLNELGREREALDFLNAVRSVYKFDPRIDQVRARSLQLLGRGEEAEQVLAKLGSDSTSIRFSKAEAALANKDYEAAEAELRAILESDPPRLEAVQMLLRIFSETDRKPEGATLIASVMPRATDPNARRQLEAWNIILTEDDPTKREELLESIVKDEADPFQREINLYRLAAMKNDLATAQTHLDAAEKLKPKDRQVLEFQFGLAAQQKEWDRAESYVNRLRDINADNAGGSTYRGALEMAKGNLEEALKYFYDAETKLPSLSTLKFKIAQAHAGLGQTERALEVLNEAMKSNPKDVAVRRLLYALLREQGKNEEAAEHLRAAVAIAPNDPTLKAEREFLEEEDDPAAGINRRLARLKEKPDDVENIQRIAELALKARDLAIKAGRADKRDEAIALAEKMIQRGLEVDPAHTPMVNFARRYYAETGEVNKAEAIIRNYAAKSDNRNGRLGAELMLADLYEKVGQYEKVDQSFARAREVVSGADEPEKQRRMTLMQLMFTELQYNARIGREDRSLEIAGKIKEMVNRDDADEARFYRLSQIQLARSLLAQRKAAEAEPILTEYLKLNANDTNAIMLRAEMWLQRGAMEKSIDDLSKVLAEQPDNVLVRFTRGDLLMRTRQYTSAQQDLQRVKTQVLESKDAELKDQFYLMTLSKLATLFEITEQYAQAETELRAMIDDLGRSLEQQVVQQGVADRLLRLLKRTDKLDKAERVCAEFMAKYREAPYWPFQLGLLLNEGKKFSAAADR